MRWRSTCLFKSFVVDKACSVFGNLELAFLYLFAELPAMEKVHVVSSRHLGRGATAGKQPSPAESTYMLRCGAPRRLRVGGCGKVSEGQHGTEGGGALAGRFLRLKEGGSKQIPSAWERSGMVLAGGRFVLRHDTRALPVPGSETLRGLANSKSTARCSVTTVARNLNEMPG